MIIAITGGSGFIGKRLVNHHIQQGDRVRLLSRKPLLKDTSVQYFFGDLSNPGVDLASFVDNVDILYHCAGEVNNEFLMQELHVNGTQRLIDAAQGKIGRWVQLSSVGVYGTCQDGTITENSKEQPFGIYERTKTESDKIVKNSGISYVILRPSNVFGMEMTNQSLFQLIHMINKGLFFYLGREGVLVNYIDVKDVVEALFLCGNHHNAPGKVYNLSQTITLEKMVLAFSLGLGVKNKFLRLPEVPIRALVKIFTIFFKPPLTSTRIDALTNRCTYKSNKIIEELNFEFKSTLEGSFQLIAEKK
jgi:nucleoside-diphosphate-sugar epimerase